jgi:hypothetical protein
MYALAGDTHTRPMLITNASRNVTKNSSDYSVSSSEQKEFETAVQALISDVYAMPISITDYDHLVFSKVAHGILHSIH